MFITCYFPCVEPRGVLAEVDRFSTKSQKILIISTPFSTNSHNFYNLGGGDFTYHY